ncbi:hypothetical protein ACIQ1D_19165 [Lysinibacillus xylanilyticus]|uniref:hypothetical protein n=1 Tax=Lysinibacillus xylanilyticus TaxID=582475 RepID=UPI00380FDE2B
MGWIDAYQQTLKEDKEEKERLSKMFPNSVIKNVQLLFLKKIGHMLEIPHYSSLSKRKLIQEILDIQQKYRELDSGLYNYILYATFNEDVCIDILVNENCKFYPYIMRSEKYQ